jgi:Flp pilus assembly protein TadG
MKITFPNVRPRGRRAPDDHNATPGYRGRWQRLWRDEMGGVALVAGLAMPMLIGVIGVGVDFGVWFHMKDDMQHAADSAAVAAAINNTKTYATEAKSVTARYGYADGVDGIRVTVASGQTCPDGTNDCYRVTIDKAKAPAYFSAMLGYTGTALSSTAVAIGNIPLCILSLNATDSGAVDMNGNPVVNGATCGLQANSTSTSGLTQEGKPQATLRRISVSGGYTGNGYNVTPLTNQKVIADPYTTTLVAAFPPYTACTDFKGLDIKNDTTISAGTYCGGIHINSSAKVTMQPGIYVMNGGPLWINGGATVTGTEVMIGLTGDGATLYAEGNATLNLTSPTSGTYQNIQFFEDPAQVVDPKKGLWFSIGGGRNNDASDGTKITVDGMIYIPKLSFWDFGGAKVTINSPTMALVAEKIWVQGNVNLKITTNNGRGLSLNGSPNTRMVNAGLVK